MSHKILIGLALFTLASLSCGGDSQTRGTGSDGGGDAMVAGNSASEEAMSPCAPLVNSSSLTAYAGKVTALSFSGGSVTVGGTETTVSADDVTGVQLVNPTTSETVDVSIVGKNVAGDTLVAKVPTSSLLSGDYQIKVLTGISACSTITLNDKVSVIDRPSLGTVTQDSDNSITVDFAGTGLELFDFREGISVFVGTLGVKKIDPNGNVLSFVKYIDGTGVGDTGKTLNQFSHISSVSQVDLLAYSPPKGETGAPTRPITVIDIVTGEQRVTIDTGLGSLQGIAISPAGDYVVAGLLTTVKLFNISTDSNVLSDEAQSVSVPAGCGALKKIRWFSKGSDFILVHESCVLKRNVSSSSGDANLSGSNFVNVVLFRDEDEFKISTIDNGAVVKTYTFSSNSGFTQSGSDIDCDLSGVADAEMSLDDATLHLVSDDGATHCAVDFASRAATKATWEAAVYRIAINSEDGDSIRVIKRASDATIRKFKKPD